MNNRLVGNQPAHLVNISHQSSGQLYCLSRNEEDSTEITRRERITFLSTLGLRRCFGCDG